MREGSKKLCVGALSVGLVLTLSIGGTIAFMTRETEKRVNNFSFADGNKALSAMLTEPAWDGVIDYEYGDGDDGTIKNVIYDYIDHDNDPGTQEIPVYGYIDGDVSKPVTDAAATTGRGVKPTKDQNDTPYGVEQAQNMIPGKKASKNPVITNTGTLTDTWVAAKVTFVYGSGAGANAGKPLSVTDMAKVTDALVIDWNVGGEATKWERTAGTANDVSQVFYYQSLLKKGADGAAPGVYGDVTTPVFSSVSVKEDAIAEQINALRDIGGIAVYVEGFAAQDDVGDTYSAFKAWGFGTDTNAGTSDDNVKFTNTPTDATPAVLTQPGIIPAN